MEGLICSLLDACNRKAMREIIYTFCNCVEESGEVDEITGESFLYWLHDQEEWDDDCVNFNKEVDTFCNAHIAEDPEKIAYYVKLAYGTGDLEDMIEECWREDEVPTTKRIKV